jgi:hypothetical protein
MIDSFLVNAIIPKNKEVELFLGIINNIYFKPEWVEFPIIGNSTHIYSERFSECNLKQLWKEDWNNLYINNALNPGLFSRDNNEYKVLVIRRNYFSQTIQVSFKGIENQVKNILNLFLNPNLITAHYYDSVIAYHHLFCLE